MRFAPLLAAMAVGAVPLTLLGLALLFIGLVLVNEKHAVALRYEKGTYLLAANSYKASARP